MARATGASGILDIRTISIIHDMDELPIENQGCNGSFQSPEIFDSKKAWHLLLGVIGLCGITTGILHVGLLFSSHSAKIYSLTIVDTVLISTLTYALHTLTSPFAAHCVKSFGPRYISVFGLLLGFLGLCLQSLQIHKFLYIIGNLILGIGTSFVQTASSNCVVDFFCKKLNFAILLLSCASPVGTIIFIIFSYTVGITGMLMYKWILIIYAILLICAVGIAQVLPVTISFPGHSDVLKETEVAQKLKQCLNDIKFKKTKENFLHKQDKQSLVQEYSCVCRCVLEIGILLDVTLYLWAGICFCAMLTFYMVFAFLLAYVYFEFNFEVYLTIQFVIGFCICSIASRVIILHYSEFTFRRTCYIFQAGLFVSAILYFTFTNASTSGWVFAYCFVLGATEGIFVITIPRITFFVFPTKNLASAWQYLMVFHSFGAFVGPTLMVLLRASNGGEITFPCILIGTFQILALLLTFLLPQNSSQNQDDAKSSGATDILNKASKFEHNEFSEPYSWAANPLMYTQKYAKASRISNMIKINDDMTYVGPIIHTFVPNSSCNTCEICSKLGDCQCEPNFLSLDTMQCIENLSNRNC